MWDCSQNEDSIEEGDVIDWYEDDEMLRQWEEVSEEEEKIVNRKTEGNGLQIEGVRRVPELLVSQVLTEEKELKKRKEKERWQVGSRRRWNRKQTTSWMETQRKWCVGGAKIKRRLTIFGKTSREN